MSQPLPATGPSAPQEPLPKAGRTSHFLGADHRCPWWHTATYPAVIFLPYLFPGFTVGIEPHHIPVLVVCMILALPAIFLRHRLPFALPTLGIITLILTPAASIADVGFFSLTLRHRDWKLAAFAGAAIVSVVLFAPHQLPAEFLQRTDLTFFDWFAEYTFLFISLILAPVLLAWFVATRRDLERGLRLQLTASISEREALARAAVLEERARIAGDMHDSLGHHLVIIATQAGNLEVNAARGTQFVEVHSRMIGDAARSALKELREVVGTLRPTDETDQTLTPSVPLAPGPSMAEVSDVVERARTAGARVTFLNEIDDDVPPLVGAAIYRVVQEGLTNAMKHAPGEEITVKLVSAGDPPVAHLQVTNAVSAGRPRRSGGTGLARLQGRLRVLGGDLVVNESSLQFSLLAHLPLSRNDRGQK